VVSARSNSVRDFLTLGGSDWNFGKDVRDRYFRPCAAAVEQLLDAGETKETKEGKGAKEDEGKEGKEGKESKESKRIRSRQEELEEIATAVGGDGTGLDRLQFYPKNGLGFTGLHDEFAHASAVNYMLKCSIGIVIWFGCFLRQLGKPKAIKKLMNMKDPKQLLVALLATGAKVFYTIQYPGQAVVSSPADGSCHAVLGAGRLLNIAWNRKITAAGLQRCALSACVYSICSRSVGAACASVGRSSTRRAATGLSLLVHNLSGGRVCRSLVHAATCNDEIVVEANMSQSAATSHQIHCFTPVLSSMLVGVCCRDATTLAVAACIEVTALAMSTAEALSAAEGAPPSTCSFCSDFKSS
jgi:hypothetical protein